MRPSFNSGNDISPISTRPSERTRIFWSSSTRTLFARNSMRNTNLDDPLAHEDVVGSNQIGNELRVWRRAGRSRRTAARPLREDPRDRLKGSRGWRDGQRGQQAATDRIHRRNHAAHHSRASRWSHSTQEPTRPGPGHCTPSSFNGLRTDPRSDRRGGPVEPTS